MFKSRTQIIMKKVMEVGNEPAESDDPADDSDNDPTWSPVSEESYYCMSSPLTSEQIQVAELAGRLICKGDDFSVELTPKKLVQEMMPKDTIMEKLTPEVNPDEFECLPHNNLVTKEKKERPDKKGRKKNFCFYCSSLVTNFSRHLLKNHPDTKEGSILKEIDGSNVSSQEKKKQKTRATSGLIKLGNFQYNKTVCSDVNKVLNVIPVKCTKSAETYSINKRVVCRNCKGVYSRTKLNRHIRYYCTGDKRISSPLKSPLKGKVNALRNHSLPLITTDASKEFQSEIMTYMRGDELSSVAQSDKLIVKMGVQFHKSRRHGTERRYISREMRDMARFLLELRKINSSINNLEDCFTPTEFGNIIKAVDNLSGYDQTTGDVKVCGMAYRILQPLQHCLRIHRADVTQNIHCTDPSDRGRLDMVSDLMQMIKDNWANQVGRTSTKSLKMKKSLKQKKIAVVEDIKTLCTYITSKYEDVIKHLKKHPTDLNSYDVLTDMLVSHIMCLVRRRPVDFTRGSLEHYKQMNIDDHLIKMISNDMSEEDIDKCKQFHVFFIPGKEYKEVPIVLTDVMKRAMDTLISVRGDVGITTNGLFSHALNRACDPTQCLNRMKNKVSLRKPEDLTNNGLRHQAATFSKLHSEHPLYQDHLATTLGHTLHVHKKNYDLPTTISQKLIVAPILHNMTTEEPPESSSIRNVSKYENKDTESNVVESKSAEEDVSKAVKRKRWSQEEKDIVYGTFGKYIIKGECPSRKAIKAFKMDNDNDFGLRTLNQLVTFINNAAKRKCLNVTPEVKEAMVKKKMCRQPDVDKVKKHLF